MEEDMVFVGPETSESHADCSTIREEGGLLDRDSAFRLYKAFELQGKNQLEMALHYFQMVLKIHPDCVEAQDGARATSAIIEERWTNSAAASISEEARMKNKHCQTVEFEVEWAVSHHGYWPDVQQAAFVAAKSHLERSGHSNSLLELLDTIITKDARDTVTNSGVLQGYLCGRSKFRVTLIPDDPQQPAGAIDDEWETISDQTLPTRAKGKCPISVESMPTDGTTFSTLTMSQFQDASDDVSQSSPWLLVDAGSTRTEKV